MDRCLDCWRRPLATAGCSGRQEGKRAAAGSALDRPEARLAEIVGLVMASERRLLGPDPRPPPSILVVAACLSAGGAWRRALWPAVAPAPRLTDALMLTLMLAALLFALLGVAIHRWASDPGVGAIFLVFSGSSATALAVIPGALMGSAWAYFLAATAATIAAPALSAVVLWFPRPLRWARPVLGLLAALTVCLVVPIVAVLAQRPGCLPCSTTCSSPGWLSSSARPPCSSASVRTTHRPMPEPARMTRPPLAVR